MISEDGTIHNGTMVQEGVSVAVSSPTSIWREGGRGA